MAIIWSWTSCGAPIWFGVPWQLMGCLLFTMPPSWFPQPLKRKDFPVAQMKKNLPATQETRAWSLGEKHPLEKGMATHSSILAWRIPRTEGLGGLRSRGSQRVGHDWAAHTHPKESSSRRSPPLCSSAGWARSPACVCCVRSCPAPAGCLSHARPSRTAAAVTGRWTAWAALPPRTETSPAGWWRSCRWPRRGAPRGGKARGAATWAWGLTPTPSTNTRGPFFQLHTSYSI